MEVQLDLKSKAKNQLKKLKYLEIDIKSYCLIERIFSDEDFPNDCNNEYRTIPDFLWVYVMDSCAVVDNPIETIIALDYKRDDYVYNLRLEDIPKTVFFLKKLKDFDFYDEIRCLSRRWTDKDYCRKKENLSDECKWEPYFSDTPYETKDFRVLIVAFENFGNTEKCEFSISFPGVFQKMFKSKDELKKIENLIIKEIKESVPYAKPKNLANYHEKIFDFLSNRYEYNSEFVDINKAYLGKKVENIYNLLLKENYNFSKKTKINPIQNVFTFETYENLLKKFEKYGIKKLDLNIENRDKFILSWFDKFGPEYRKYCIEPFW